MVPSFRRARSSDGEQNLPRSLEWEPAETRSSALRLLRSEIRAWLNNRAKCWNSPRFTSRSIKSAPPQIRQQPHWPFPKVGLNECKYAARNPLTKNLEFVSRNPVTGRNATRVLSTVPQDDPAPRGVHAQALERDQSLAFRLYRE